MRKSGKNFNRKIESAHEIERTLIETGKFDAVKVMGKDDPITQSLSIRLKKMRIAEEYHKRRSEGEEKQELIYDLSKKHYYSEKTIRNIVYTYREG